MNLRPRLCIPVFDNAGTVVHVVRGCIAATTLPILVVDDGSTVPVENLLRADPTVAPMIGSRVEILRLQTNRGKGAAIAKAFQDSVAAAYTHLLTVDGDGQHLPETIPALLAKMYDHPWSLIVGSRDLQAAAAPPISRFGRKFSNFWVRFETERKVGDSQSGLRIYPLFHVQRMRFRTTRFDFEIEVLIRLLWRGVGVVDVPVQVHYPPPEIRVSHFHKIRDNARISFLNAILVVLTLLKGRLAPWPVARALAVGTFIGCTPFFGFHTILAAAAALLLRLNAGLVFAGSCVSTPPVGIAIAALSIQVGHIVLGEAPPPVSEVSLATARAWWRFWVTGSVPVGIASALIVGALGFLVASLLREGKKKRAWSGKTRGGKLGNLLVDWILRTLGLRAGYFCLCFIVPYFVVFAPRGTRASLEFWSLLHPKEGFLRRLRRVFGHYYRFGTVLMDRRAQAMSDRQLFESNSKGFESMMKSVQDGRGLVLASAHVGSWDIAASYMKHSGYEGTFSPVRFDAIGDVEAPSRQRGEAPNGVRPLAANRIDNPIFHIHSLLSNRKPVGLMADRPMGRHYELVPFFGYLAPLDATAFRLAAATGTPVTFSFGFKGEGNRYDFFATDVKEYRFEPGEEREVQMGRWLREFAATLEPLVRKYPTQWFNFYSIWSVMPAKREG